MLCLEHCFTWLVDLDTKQIGAEVFGELRNVVLVENGENKMPGDQCRASSVTSLTQLLVD